MKNYAMYILDLLKLNINHVWCLIVHDFILGKHKMHKAYGPYKCEVCGRIWDIF